MSEFEYEEERRREQAQEVVEAVEIREGHALGWVPESLRWRIKTLVHRLDPDRRAEPHAYGAETLDFRVDPADPDLGGLDFSLGRASLERLTPEIERFHAQTKALGRLGLPTHYAMMRDAADPERRLPTPVVAPIPISTLNSGSKGRIAFLYAEAVESLRRSDIRIETSNPEQLTEAFIDRVSEFAAVGRQAGLADLAGKGEIERRVGSSGQILTEVHTNRANDTVLVCLGYFASTVSAFGVSTPAVAELPPGRYSFGIRDRGQNRLDDLVWNCPARVKVDLP